MVATSAGCEPLVSRREMALLLCALLPLITLFAVLSVQVWHSSGPVGLDRLGHRLVTGTRLAPPPSWAGLEGVRSSRLAHVGVRLGEPSAVTALAGLVLYLGIACRDWIGSVLAVVTPGVTGLLTEYVAKPLIDRQTPSGTFMFPSGHTSGVAAVCLVASVIVYRRGGGRAAALAAPVTAAPLALVGLGVVELGFHWSTDVAGGVALAGTVVVALTAMLVVTGRLVANRLPDPRVRRAQVAGGRGGRKARGGHGFHMTGETAMPIAPPGTPSPG